MSQRKTIKSTDALRARLAEARAQLGETLADGGDTAALRREITELERAIDAHERQAHAAQERLALVQIEQQAELLAEQAHDAVAAAADVPGLAELADEPLPAVERDPLIDAAAAQVARCRAALELAESAVRPMIDQHARLTARLNEKRSHIESIRARRLAGDEQPGDPAEMLALSEDCAALALLVGDAALKVQTQDARQQAHAALVQAEQGLVQARQQAEFRAAVERVRQAETVYLATWNRAAEAGRAVGRHSPWSEFPASAEMRRAVTGAVSPSIGRL